MAILGIGAGSMELILNKIEYTEEKLFREEHH
jgi:hypothetical protein